MKVSMKQMEAWCGEYSQRWNKKAAWDSFILVQDGWLNGYRSFKEQALKELSSVEDNTFISVLELKELLSSLGENKIEVEIAGHQIGAGEVRKSHDD